MEPVWGLCCRGQSLAEERARAVRVPRVEDHTLRTRWKLSSQEGNTCVINIFFSGFVKLTNRDF